MVLPLLDLPKIKVQLKGDDLLERGKIFPREEGREAQDQ
jgi:hypothetical protein